MKNSNPLSEPMPPNDWKTIKLGDVADILDNLRIPVTASDRKSGVYPYDEANGFQDYVDDYRCYLQKTGDILAKKIDQSLIVFRKNAG